MTTQNKGGHARLGANDHPDHSTKLYCAPLDAGRINCDLAALQHVDAAVGEHLHDLGIQHVLNRVDVLLERVDIPASSTASARWAMMGPLS